jgi:hypothetical protein
MRFNGLNRKLLGLYGQANITPGPRILYGLDKIMNAKLQTGTFGLDQLSDNHVLQLQ